MQYSRKFAGVSIDWRGLRGQSKQSAKRRAEQWQIYSNGTDDEIAAHFPGSWLERFDKFITAMIRLGELKVVKSPCQDCGKPKVDNVKRVGKRGVDLLTKKTNKRKPLGPGPGTELSLLLPKQLERKGCGCKDYAKKMNRWGVEGCRQRFDDIVEHLVMKANSAPLLGWVPSVATKPVAKRLLTIAIERADKHTVSDSSFEWFTAVTTAPRPECTLQQCIDSLIVAGFNPTIFAEPDSTKIESCPTIVNPEKMGVWYNWLKSCEHALNNTTANVIMTVQDDSLFHPDCKTFAEKILWPSKSCGFVSLYTPKHYSVVPHFKTKERDMGVNRVYTRSLWGACALIWPREVLEAVLEHKITKTWLGAPTKSRSQSVMDKRRADRTLVQNSDTAIGKIMNRMKRSMYFVDPSPVEHISQYSVVGHGGNKGRRNCKRCAKWAEPLEDQVPINFDPVKIVI